ncbi:hypothetical protein [Streptomyces sp. 5-10]|uniref:hypothetical protein n=1 Tax=Streptomyces sp. 5-10 TaxID=878925 RepID=UPI0019858E17|nr:hypothetical protein [Streptomyces sp. 5-10]MBD3004609.1 hypothetical protein [Streptomyces sp. 5-10]
MAHGEAGRPQRGLISANENDGKKGENGMEMLSSSDLEPEITYHMMYRLEGVKHWFSGGDLDGYPTIEEARAAGEGLPPAVQYKGTRTVSVVEVGFYKRTITVEPVE